tara:strand:- start:52 stop:234 length:183 start_codon:yes stop_codon:yes gene_type:complete
MNKSEKTAITSLTGIVMIVVLALATSCSTMQTAHKSGVKKKFNGKLVSYAHNYNACPAYQ